MKGAIQVKKIKHWLSGTILTIAAVGQIVLTILCYRENGTDWIRNTGWIILWISAIFGWLPIRTFRKWGKVKGRGYMRTTVLVDRGIYGIVRHPQYVAGMLMGIALPLIAQHWIVAVPGVIVIAINYIDTVEEERAAVVKFGEAYERYRETVPRINFISGCVRKFSRGKKGV